MSKKKKSKASKNEANPLPGEIKGFMSLAAGLAILLSLLSFAYRAQARNWLGIVGHTVGWIFYSVIGLSSYFVCIFLFWIGWRLLFSHQVRKPALKVSVFCIFLLSSSILLSLIEDTSPSMASSLRNNFYPLFVKQKINLHLGGAPAYYLYRDIPFINMLTIFNRLGVGLIFSTSFIASLLFLLKIRPGQCVNAIKKFINALRQEVQEQNERGTVNPTQAPASESQSGSLFRFVKLRIPGTTPPAAATANQGSQQEMLAIKPERNLKDRPSLSRKVKEIIDTPLQSPKASPLKELPAIKEAPKELPAPKESGKETDKQKRRETALAAQKVYNGDFKAFNIPQPAMLSNPKRVDQTSLKKDLRRQAEVLEETLLSFGIEAKVGQINCGPTITSFEVHPSIGVKVQKIKTLENDIALNMEAKSIRIIAPIPGKAAVGIEVPNPQPQEVGFKDMLAAYQQSGRKFHIPVLLGKAVNGDYVMNDLTKMPHCIIAGATGSGKSVCINTIVMSILMNARPDEIKLLMVDPKKVELTPYTKLPHMLAPVITEPQGACAALNWLVKEMEARYEILKQLGVRNIEAFNNRAANKEFEESLDLEIPLRLPYIVGIIDELADLMMVSSNDIETPIARIAQMARAVGIHLILATQRPSREVITGLIKANFPTRISFKVASRVNSQIVLDEVGAETLLGNGDMLFLPPGASHLIRAQGAFIRDEDINTAIKHICDQAPPNYVIQSFDKMGSSLDDGFSDEDEPSDSLFEQAKQIVISSGNASTTFLQRKLKIGYSRAASLIDELETKGVVGPAEGSKARKVISLTPIKQEENARDEAEEDDEEP